MKRKAFLFLSVVILVLGGILHAEGIRDAVPNDALRNEGLIILHTNDLHGLLLPESGHGGISEIAFFVGTVRDSSPNVLLLDAGDFNTGGALSNIFDAEPNILAFNIMGYDAVTFGNHEFDGSMEKLNKQIALAKFPFVSSNIRTADGSFLGGNRYIIKKFENFTVGIFGITTTRTPAIASPDSSLVFLNETDAARETVDILRNVENVDIVIGLTHMGNIKETDDHITSIRLAKDLEGIDIIVDGHSHTVFGPRTAGDAWVVSAGERGSNIGRGQLTIRDRKIVDFIWTAVPNTLGIGTDHEIDEMIEPYAARANDLFSEVIGHAADTFEFGNRLTRFQETALGNMICDANVWFFRNQRNMNIDFAFHNGGNMRAELPQGPITQERILTILPFENYLHVVSMTGSQIIELFNFIATIPQGNGAFPQFSSEVRYTIDKTSGAGVIRDLTIGGEAVDPDRIYRFCTNDYIVGGGDGYSMMANATDPFNASILLSYVVAEYIKSLQAPVEPATDGRLTVIGGVVDP